MSKTNCEGTLGCIVFLSEEIKFSVTIINKTFYVNRAKFFLLLKIGFTFILKRK